MQFISEYSFCATLKCQNDGFEGFMGSSIVYHLPPGTPQRRWILQPSDFLVMNNWYNFPERNPQECQRFHFRAMWAPSGMLVYNIWTEHGRRKEPRELSVDADGWLVWTRLGAQPKALWYVSWPQLLKSEDIKVGARLNGMGLKSVGDTLMPSMDLALLMDTSPPVSGPVVPEGRSDASRYWNAFLRKNGNSRAQPFTADVFVKEVGLKD